MQRQRENEIVQQLLITLKYVRLFILMIYILYPIVMPIQQNCTLDDTDILTHSFTLQLESLIISSTFFCSSTPCIFLWNTRHKSQDKTYKKYHKNHWKQREKAYIQQISRAEKGPFLIDCNSKFFTLSETHLWPSSYSTLHGLWK